MLFYGQQDFKKGFPEREFFVSHNRVAKGGLMVNLLKSIGIILIVLAILSKLVSPISIGRFSIMPISLVILANASFLLALLSKK